MFNEFACKHMGITFPCAVSFADKDDASVNVAGVAYDSKMLTDIYLTFSRVGYVDDIIVMSGCDGCDVYVVGGGMNCCE